MYACTDAARVVCGSVVAGFGADGVVAGMVVPYISRYAAMSGLAYPVLAVLSRRIHLAECGDGPGGVGGLGGVPGEAVQVRVVHRAAMSGEVGCPCGWFGQLGTAAGFPGVLAAGGHGRRLTRCGGSVLRCTAAECPDPAQVAVCDVLARMTNQAFFQVPAISTWRQCWFAVIIQLFPGGRLTTFPDSLLSGLDFACC